MLLYYRKPVMGGLMDGGLSRSLLLRAGLALGLMAPAAAHARFMGVYDYPFVSPLAATVAATPPANQVRQIPAREFVRLVEVRYLDPFPDRKIPPVFWYFDQGMPYTVLKQNRPRAPLFFIIGGTGAGHDFGQVVRPRQRALPGGLPCGEPAQPDPFELHCDRLHRERAWAA